MTSNRWTICVTCRKAWRGSPTCKHQTMLMPRHYRVPRRRNDRAWKRIAVGDIWWEDSKVAAAHRVRPWWWKFRAGPRDWLAYWGGKP